MKKLTAIAAIPLFAGFLMAQTETQTTTTRTTTRSADSNTLNGTLIDAGCYTSNTAHRETTETSHPDENTTRTTTTRSDSYVRQCPVTETTTTFGLVTPQGQYVTFDQPSNTRVIEVMKHNKHWKTYITEHKPVPVTVVGNRRGDTFVIETIK